MDNLNSNGCTVCGKTATGVCEECGHFVCDDHKEHGFKLRTNDPVINCPGCQKKRAKKLRIFIIIFTIIFISLSIITTIYLINTLPFL